VDGRGNQSTTPILAGEEGIKKGREGRKERGGTRQAARLRFALKGDHVNLRDLSFSLGARCAAI